MPKYVIDTNLYVHALRDPDARDALRSFTAASSPWIYVHAVVAAELLAGAPDPRMEEAIQTSFLAPFEAMGRVIVPRHDAWKRAGRTIGELIREHRLSANGVKPSFFRDCLLATSARDEGITIITGNTRDFELIRTVEPVKFVPPWPGSER
ncbi:PIN domain-containing protein [Longimicrobium terrae]|uniref:Putative nucleic acid-binding protein n=1 Tax=Longimicrobium terrae TaxID=1639882 RepID=A0A841H0P0_9BACT|nr:putative nucleic acid-binding protein [Longimicrobium terrae]MBB6071499.1 putative nucleic acid-binding protein [Longimicrobium terrae]NNC30078.1 PIN domain-containing protein [Longimicrobium terrae]